MPNYPAPQSTPRTILERAQPIRLAAFDVDGTMTDGKLCYTSEGIEIKAFHAHDGHGLKRLMAIGIQVAIITARESPAVSMRADELDIKHIYQGIKDKQACLASLQRKLHIEEHQTVFMGDDLSDVPAMQIAGLAIAVANAHPDVLPFCHMQTHNSGGHGAIREACDMLVYAQKLTANNMG